VRLDHFLAQRTAQLSIDTRLETVRQIAEALKFAHDKHALHGALSPPSILVFGPNSAIPRHKLYNWQTAFHTASTSTSGLTQITATVHPDVFWEDASRAYLAPELVNDPTLRGEHVDVSSLGAIAKDQQEQEREHRVRAIAAGVRRAGPSPEQGGERREQRQQDGRDGPVHGKSEIRNPKSKRSPKSECRIQAP
jgi:serine/threonine protein kinase